MRDRPEIENAISHLAQTMFEGLERLDPPEEPARWEDLNEFQRDTYYWVARRMMAEQASIKVALGARSSPCD